VSYREKHNDANGEGNHDGTNENFSDNCGAEGDTTDTPIESLRARQIKNFLLTLLISRGVPMLLGGDEFRRTQGGNNNAYNQDNETSWYDWRFLARHRDISRFAREMTAFRRTHPILSKERFYTEKEIQWFDGNGGLPDWSDSKARHVACLVHEEGPGMLYLVFNAGSRAVDFRVPAAPKGASRQIRPVNRQRTFSTKAKSRCWTLHRLTPQALTAPSFLCLGAGRCRKGTVLFHEGISEGMHPDNQRGLVEHQVRPV
jgi:isoamylase